jgi:hypothetical protein
MPGSRPHRRGALLAALLLALAAPAAGASLGATVLWHATAPDLVQSGPQPARERYRPLPGEHFVLLSLDVRQLESTAAGRVLRVRGSEIRLRTPAGEHPMIGTFEDAGAIVWLAPTLSIFPSGSTRLNAIFSVPSALRAARLELGSELDLELPAPRARPGVEERVQLAVQRARWAENVPGLSTTPVHGVAAVPEPWPGQQFLLVELELRRRDTPDAAAFSLTSADLYVQGGGSLFPCAGQLRSETAGFRSEPQGVTLVPGVDGKAAVRRLQLLFAVERAAAPLWLHLGDISVPLEPAER